LLEVLKKFEDDIALAESANALEDGAAAPEATQEIQVSLRDTLPIELQKLIVTFVKKKTVRSRESTLEPRTETVCVFIQWLERNEVSRSN